MLVHVLITEINPIQSRRKLKNTSLVEEVDRWPLIRGYNDLRTRGQIDRDRKSSEKRAMHCKPEASYLQLGPATEVSLSEGYLYRA